MNMTEVEIAALKRMQPKWKYLDDLLSQMERKADTSETVSLYDVYVGYGAQSAIVTLAALPNSSIPLRVFNAGMFLYTGLDYIPRHERETVVNMTRAAEMSLRIMQLRPGKLEESHAERILNSIDAIRAGKDADKRAAVAEGGYAADVIERMPFPINTVPKFRRTAEIKFIKAFC